MASSYEVGYGKPPVHSRWKPGQSGHPNGKRKRTKAFKTIFLDALNAPVLVQDKGKPRRMSRFEVLVTALMNDAMKGNHRSRKLVLDTLIQLERAGALESAAKPRPAADEKIIARLKARLTREAK